MRVNDAADAADLNAYVFAYRWDNNQWRILKKTGTSFSTLAQVSEAAPSLPFTVRLEAEGNELRGYVNGDLKLSAGDSSFGGSGHRRVGFLGNDGLNATVDDFVAGDLN